MVEGIALVLSATAIGVTFALGWVVHTLRRTEHDWQTEARKSAHIRVTVRHVYEQEEVFEKLTTRTQYFLELTNVGQAQARDVKWVELNERDRLDAFGVDSGIGVIHPGETFELFIHSRTIGEHDPLDVQVTWTDDMGKHKKRTILGTT